MVISKQTIQYQYIHVLYVRIVCMYVRMYVCMYYIQYVCMYVCIYICIYVASVHLYDGLHSGILLLRKS